MGLKILLQNSKVKRKDRHIMKVIKTGMTYEIFDNELKTFDKLPVQCYYMKLSISLDTITTKKKGCS